MYGFGTGTIKILLWIAPPYPVKNKIYCTKKRLTIHSKPFFIAFLRRCRFETISFLIKLKQTMNQKFTLKTQYKKMLADTLTPSEYLSEIQR